MDFSKLDSLMHQFKSSSTSIGAKKVKTECIHFRSHCKARNAEGCKRTYQQVKKEYSTLKKKLETFFQTHKSETDGGGVAAAREMNAPAAVFEQGVGVVEVMGEQRRWASGEGGGFAVVVLGGAVWGRRVGLTCGFDLVKNGGGGVILNGVKWFGYWAGICELGHGV
ncbi:HPT phosphotransmitter 4 [Artemisia annua]|uniref:Histidine-containing phosphotransfer protein n=1 Tax=Artemisia annua TaxID=35608 RepID=A0A2U1N203_ARTAN|nr:HPT phosphotransmitter 4 [Artemisia annua]